MSVRPASHFTYKHASKLRILGGQSTRRIVLTKVALGIAEAIEALVMTSQFVHRNSRTRRSAAMLCLVSCLLLTCSLVAPPALHAKEKLNIGDTPPDNLGRDASGNRVRLGDHRGKIVIVSFWASWCSPCRKEMATLAAIQKKATREKIVIFAVNWQESREQFWQIKHALKDIDLTLVSDESGSLGRQYEVTAIPHMIIIGRDGRVAAIHVGYGESEIPSLVGEINTLWNEVPE